MAGIVVTKLIREHTELKIDPQGRTLGQQVDDQVRLALESDSELGKIELHMEPEEWFEIRKTWAESIAVKSVMKARRD